MAKVRIKIHFSSINYKDALALNGHPGVAKQVPLIPGIDGAGTVIESETESFKAGQEVVIFHAQMGTECHGAYADEIMAPETWVYSKPSGLTLRECMILGTAGFTAGQCLEELLRHDITTDRGEIVVSGATGGVGVFGVKLLAKLGYDVVAATGKTDRHGWLKEHGATDVIGRQELVDDSERPLLKSRWAGAIDTVGSSTLASIIRSTKPFGCVTACGLAGGIDLATTVYPYILRGITLQGVDTANIARERRKSIWEKLGTDWKLGDLESLATEVDLENVDDAAANLLAGTNTGRVLVKVAG